jgi:hypothetical protein
MVLKTMCVGRGKGYRNKEASSKITAQMRTIYVTAQSAPIAGAGESADSA